MKNILNIPCGDKNVVDVYCSAMDLGKMVLMSISYSFLLDAFVH
tara:strand:+ start:558 stop:689 length:132 start_codon:yes stop_codon:yes gene_type:complete